MKKLSHEERELVLIGGLRPSRKGLLTAFSLDSSEQLEFVFSPISVQSALAEHQLCFRVNDRTSECARGVV